MTMAAVLLDASTLTLINRYQHNMPLTLCPYASMADTLGWPRDRVLQILKTLERQKVLSRFGPVFEHSRAGSSTLVAMAVPPERLEDVALHVNGYVEVNHNYEREHFYNLWFVLTAADQQGIDDVLASVLQATGIQPFSLPMRRAFHIDLGFPLARDVQGRVVAADSSDVQAQEAHGVTFASLQIPTRRRDDFEATSVTAPPSKILDKAARLLLRQQLEDGLPIEPNPWRSLARTLGVSADDVLSQVRQWQANGLFRRCGIVVRHHPLGIRANLMLVMDIHDDDIAQLGKRLGVEPGVTLCYQRQRHLPQWPYNLFCMIHGHDRAAVERRAHQLLSDHDLGRVPHQFLFSLRAFKQRGGRYLPRVSHAQRVRPVANRLEAT